MYNVELYNRTTGQVLANQPAASECDAAAIVLDYIERAKRTGRVLAEIGPYCGPRGFLCGAKIYTTAGMLEISTGKM